MTDGVSTEIQHDVRRSINFGYLILPDSEEISVAITKAMRSRRFTVMLEKGGGILHNCFSVESAINDFEFPKVKRGLGSQVAFMQEPIGGKAVIIGVVNSNTNRKFYEANQYVIECVSDNAVASIIVDGKGKVSIDVISTNNDPAILNINVSNPAASSQVNVKVKGLVNLEVDGSFTINNRYGNTNWVCNNFNLDMKRLKVGEGKEPMVLGKELKTQIEKTNDVVKAIKDSILNWTTSPTDGGAALKAYFLTQIGTSVPGDFDKINSEKSFLD